MQLGFIHARPPRPQEPRRRGAGRPDFILFIYHLKLSLKNLSAWSPRLGVLEAGEAGRETFPMSGTFILITR